MQTQSLMPASAASMIESAAKGGGTNTIEASAPVSCTAPLTVLNTGMSEMALAALAGGDAADHVGAVALHVLGVEAADLAGKALDDDAGVLVEQNGHVSISLKQPCLRRKRATRRPPCRPPRPACPRR